MNNYPPGVTGRELAIAGPDWEGLVERECQIEDTTLTVVPAKILEALTYAIGPNSASTSEGIARLIKDLKHDTFTVEGICPFEGEVEIWTYQRMAHWTCPLCDYEHTEDTADWDDEP